MIMKPSGVRELHGDPHATIDNMNFWPIADKDGDDVPLPDPGASTDVVEVHFRDLETKLCRWIRQYDTIVGAVAWLTNKKVLRELQQRKEVALVVQKEDFLRPDMHDKSDWKQRLRREYEALPVGVTRFEFPGVLGKVAMGSDPYFASEYDMQKRNYIPVRCVGNHNKDKKAAMPRMHNKFLVGCKTINNTLAGLSVWTGSFNFTKNASNSLENAVVINDENIARAYIEEMGNIAAFSEDLDWTHDWAEPEWAIGT